MSCGDPHETDCQEILAEVYLYLDNECQGGRYDLIRHHLDECSPCLRQYGIEQEVKALVARTCGGEIAPSGLRDKVMGRLRGLVVETNTREFLAE